MAGWTLDGHLVYGDRPVGAGVEQDGRVAAGRARREAHATQHQLPVGVDEIALARVSLLQRASEHAVDDHRFALAVDEVGAALQARRVVGERAPFDARTPQLGPHGAALAD